MDLASLWTFILNRLKEPSTWRGIIALVTAAGVVLSPEQKEAIIGTGVAIISAINIFKKDSNSPDAKTKPEDGSNA